MDTKRCASKDVGPPSGGVDWGVPHRLEKRTSAGEDAGPRRRMDYEIPHRLGRKTKHSLKGCVETSPKQTRLKNLEGKPERENPK